MKTYKEIGYWIRCILFSLLLIFSDSLATGQILKDIFRFSRSRQKSVTLDYKYANKAVIIPLKINDSDTLHFILDSGLGNTLITELSPRDSFTINYAHKVELQGLGTGPPLEAIKSYGNRIHISSLENHSEELNVIMEDVFSLSKKTGTQIHGIIGYSLFSQFIVEIDYSHYTVTFHNPDTYKYRKWKRAITYPLEIVKNKPFIRTFVTLHNGKRIPVKLLVDTGSSMALWLAEKSNDAITIPENSFPRLLGQGLNGEIHGRIGRIQSLEIGHFKLRNVVTAFPDTLAILKTIQQDQRNGSIGGEVLRRFRVIIDYHNKKITFFRGAHFKDDFTYNMSGMEVETPYPDLPIFRIFYVSEDSPAHRAGIRAGDQIVAINGISTVGMTLDKITRMFENERKRDVKLKIQREGEFLMVQFKLEKKI